MTAPPVLLNRVGYIPVGVRRAIAALALASGLSPDGGFSREEYLDRAVLAFDVLQQRSLAFIDDHEENIIDDCCALLAATELLARMGEERWHDAAINRAHSLVARQDTDGFYWADDARTRRVVHASDAELPHIALMRFVEVLLRHDQDADVDAFRAAIRRGLAFELHAANETGTNPFGDPRQFVAMPGRGPATSFSAPHDDESGDGWQGENARWASLATAARPRATLALDDEAFNLALNTYTQRVLDGIFGANPFDTCMLHGWRHHTPRHELGLWNAPGGVRNGITSGLDDEDRIDFRKPEDTDPIHSWRWTEQWIPHAAWRSPRCRVR